MRTKKEKIKFSTIVAAQAENLIGASDAKLKQKFGISKKKLESTALKLNEIVSSNSPNLTLEKKIISEAISDHLKPIKEELALKSLEIIRKADEVLLQRLDSPEIIRTGEMVGVSDVYSKRLARLTGIEEDPNAGKEPEERSKNVNIFVQNIFAEHKKNLEKKRNLINVVDNMGITHKSIENKGENDT